MDASSSFSTTRRQLHQKNARLNARRRLLFKRRHVERDDVLAHRSRLLAREARHIRSMLMRLERLESTPLQQQTEQQNPNSAHNIGNLDERGAHGDNLQSTITHSMRPRPTEQVTNSSTLTGWTRPRRRHSFSNRWDFGRRTTTCPHCRSIMWTEERVTNSSIRNPRFNLCCQSGQVSLPLLPPSPPFLDSQLSNRHFLDNIRIYNSMFSFTSMGGRIDHSVNDGRSPYVFRINGSNHHKIGSLLPRSGVHPSFAQLYIYDTSNEVSNRVTALRASGRSGISSDIVQGLQQMLDSTNPYVAVFRRARDMLRDHGEVHDLRIRIIQAREGRQYIRPTSEEVAGLIVGDGTDHFGPRDVILQSMDGTLQRIDEHHPSYMPLHYPLLFPHGTDGWSADIPRISTSSTSRSTVSMREFYAFRIQDRLGESMVIKQSCRLGQQFYVDAWAAIEQYRLTWFENHQGRLRTELYSGIQDALNAGDVNAESIGRRYILPSSFTGGPRYMMQHYQDAIAICRALGPPDFFVTFTCNPSWPEITNELLPGQRSDDRPDLITRVFRIKLRQLLDDFKTKKIFGTVIAEVYVVEFQKRGLPHAHILLTVAPEDKPTCPEDVDRLISAEIPDQATDPLAYETVTRFMIHGPCVSCMIDGKCSKCFPKRCCNQTTFDEHGFAQYRRRRTPQQVVVNGRQVDNQWVVPYNRDLCVKYDAHINVERVAVRSVIKYLYKYVHKGHDRATIVIEGNGTHCHTEQSRSRREGDEIKEYLDCRYVSAVESCWRIFEFSLQHQYPSVQKLQYHLPGEQLVVFSDREDLFTIANEAEAQKTMLTMWFEANKTYPQARHTTYLNFPTQWVWNQSSRCWMVRQRGSSIGRLPFAHPNCGERYYFRMLLTKICGATSFEEIRTIRGVLHPTFKSACMALGLLDDDGEWHAALTEASTWAPAVQLRNMFCSMLLFSEIADPVQLWDAHWSHLTDDLLHTVRRQTRLPDMDLPSPELQNLGLLHIERILNRNGRSLRNFPPMPLPSNEAAVYSTNRLIIDELDYDTTLETSRFESFVRGLNSDQHQAYRSVLDTHNRGEGGLFFIYGSGGTGKTYLWNTVISKFRSDRHIVLAVASSGIASLLLPGGKTAHSVFKVPLQPDETSVCYFDKRSERADLIRETVLIVWDEAPMMNRLAFEAVDRHLKDICDNQHAFGGKLVLLGGDFRQILPVITHGSRESIVAATIHRATFWNECTIMHLRINMRLQRIDEPIESMHVVEEFARWLLQVGDGQVQGIAISDDGEPNWIKIPEEFLIRNDDNGLHNLIASIYPDLETKYKDWSYLRERGILAPTNDDVDEINTIMLSMLPGDMKSYLSCDTLSTANDCGPFNDMEPPELLHSLKISGLPNHSVDLKVGAPVILLRNLNQSIGLCNGTRLVVSKLGDRVIEAKLISGTRVGDTVLIPRIDLTPSNLPDLQLRRRQFPLKLAFAMTINKSQGQTLTKVGVYLPRPVFSHGQLYVALSRVSSPSGLKVLLRNKRGVPVDVTKNVVYRDVLHHL